MHFHARPSLAAAALALLFSPCAAVPAAAQDVSVRIVPGLAGAARAGRWTPIVLFVENTGRALDARITVSIAGEQRARDVALANPSRKRLEFYLRAPDSDGATVTAAVNGVTVSSSPLRIVASDAPFTVCVTASGVTAPAATCTVSLDATELPSSWRGLDAADDVVIPGGATLGEEQRLAHARWNAIHAWNASTAMAPPALMVSESSAAPASAAREVLLFAAALLLLAPASRWISTRPSALYGAVVVVAVAGSAAVLAHGRFGESAALRVNEAAVLRAGAALDGAQVIVRGTAVFPAAGDVRIATPLADAAIAIRRGGGALLADSSGDASITGRAAREQRLEYDVDGFSNDAPLAVSRSGGTIRLTNQLRSALTGCTLPASFATPPVARLAPGATVDVHTGAPSDEDVMTCRIESPDAALSWTGGGIAHRGAWFLVYDLRAPATRP